MRKGLYLQTEFSIFYSFSQDIWTNVSKSKLVQVTRCFPDHLEKEVRLFYIVNQCLFNFYLRLICDLSGRCYVGCLNCCNKF